MRSDRIQGHGRFDPASLTVGERAMVRRVLNGSERAALAGTLDEAAIVTDVVGTLMSLTDQSVMLETKNGPVAVAVGDIVSAKKLPPKPHRRRRRNRIGIDELETLLTEMWAPPIQQQVGDWVVRGFDGYTRRANSALVRGGAPERINEALKQVADAYRTHGLTPYLQLPLAPGSQATDDAVGHSALALGWRVSTGSASVMTMPCDELLAAGSGAIAVTSTDSPSAEWLAVAPIDTRADADTVMAALTRSARQVFLATAHARGRVAMYDGWACVNAVETAPEARRRGHARALMTAAAAAAATQGVEHIVIQVEDGNEPALALYRSLGFHPHHRYVYLELPETT